MYADLLENLNPEQREAVTLPPTHPDGRPQSALILAGAGSGKTRVLTTRIAWLIQTGQISPIGVLAVTFTNKAAKEMLTRLGVMLPINTRGMWVGTFMACVIDCYAHTIAMRVCHQPFKSWIRKINSQPLSAF